MIRRLLRIVEASTILVVLFAFTQGVSADNWKWWAVLWASAVAGSAIKSLDAHKRTKQLTYLWGLIERADPTARIKIRLRTNGLFDG